MKKCLFMLVPVVALLASCSGGITADQVLGSWEITALYENNQPITVTTENVYTFQSGSTYDYSVSDGVDTLTDGGNWTFNADNNVLTMTSDGATFTYTITHLEGSEMHWETTDLNGISARIELQKQ